MDDRQYFYIDPPSRLAVLDLARLTGGMNLYEIGCLFVLLVAVLDDATRWSRSTVDKVAGSLEIEPEAARLFLDDMVRRRIIMLRRNTLPTRNSAVFYFTLSPFWRSRDQIIGSPEGAVIH